MSEAVQLADEVLLSHAYTSVLADNKVALHFFGTTSADGPISQPKIELLQNHPNPFVSQTTIGFVLPESCGYLMLRGEYWQNARHNTRPVTTTKSSILKKDCLRVCCTANY